MRRQTKDKLFRIYITDGLKAITDNTSKLVRDGLSLKRRYAEIVDEIKPEEKPKETAEQIISRISFGINNLEKGG